MDDKEKIESILKALNKGTVQGEWRAGDGFHVLTKFEFGVTSDIPPTFYPSSGYPIKFFVNTKTGEVKLFAASLLRK